MKITKDNYEAWFLDYQEGALSEEQVALLLSFLEEHPELKEELDAFDDLSFAPTNISFAHKNELKLPDWSSEKREEMILSYVEGLLNSEENKLVEKMAAGDSSFRNELDLFLKTRLEKEPVKFGMNHLLKKDEALIVKEENIDILLVGKMEGWVASAQLDTRVETDPAWNRASQLYSLTRFVPDHTIVYPNKQALKRREGLVISINFYRSMAAIAAAVIGFLFWPGGNFNQEYTGREIQIALQESSLIQLDEKNELSPAENLSPVIYQLAADTKTEDHKKNTSREDKLAPVEIQFAEEKIKPIEENELEPNIAVDEKDKKQNNNNYHWNNQSKDDVLAMNNGNASQEDFLTPKEFISAKLNEKVFKGEKNQPLEKESATRSVTEQISKLTGTPVSYVNKKEEERKVFEVSVGKFSFSRTRH